MIIASWSYQYFPHHELSCSYSDSLPTKLVLPEIPTPHHQQLQPGSGHQMSHSNTLFLKLKWFLGWIASVVKIIHLVAASIGVKKSGRNNGTWNFNISFCLEEPSSCNEGDKAASTNDNIIARCIFKQLLHFSYCCRCYNITEMILFDDQQFFNYPHLIWHK